MQCADPHSSCSRSQTAGSRCGIARSDDLSVLHSLASKLTYRDVTIRFPFLPFFCFYKNTDVDFSCWDYGFSNVLFTLALFLRITSFLLSKQTKQSLEPLRLGTDSENRNNSSIQPRNSPALIMAVIYCYHLIYFLSLEDEYFMLIVKRTWRGLSQRPLWPCVP